jgi:DNA-binding HxlR family transcriptional regulator
MNSKRSVCPVACTLDLIGDRWTLLVVRDLFAGRAHFKEFSGSPEGIASNILANRLAKLVENGIAEKFPSTEVPGRDAYRLTDKGRSLLPVLRAIAAWGLSNIEGTEAKIKMST